MSSDILIGADPEFFMLDDNGNVVPACGKVGGTKEKPIPLEKGAMQEDNVLVEINIDPARTEDEFVDNLRTVIGQLPVRVAAKPSHKFDMGLLQQFGQQAMEFGCDPDYNAWTLEQNDPPNPEKVGGARVAGGHIHISGIHGFMGALGVLIMDTVFYRHFYTLPNEVGRACIYGGKGAYRSKPYGVEYRACSNFWLRSEHLARWAFRCAHWTSSYLQQFPNVNQAVHDLMARSDHPQIARYEGKEIENEAWNSDEPHNQVGWFINSPFLRDGVRNAARGNELAPPRELRAYDQVISTL